MRSTGFDKWRDQFDIDHNITEEMRCLYCKDIFKGRCCNDEHAELMYEVTIEDRTEILRERDYFKLLRIEFEFWLSDRTNND
jgi:hypothetical protein